jgi:DNA-binding response OmpR family regulator
MAQKILIVDDEPDTLTVLRVILEQADYDISTATNGREALESVASNPPELIILDQMMPEMDGLEALRRLKANPATKDIPVIILSAKDRTDDMIKGWENGTDLYLVKPINGAELTDYVNCILLKEG